MPQSGQLIAAWERDMEVSVYTFKEELACWQAVGTAFSRGRSCHILLCLPHLQGVASSAQ